MWTDKASQTLTTESLGWVGLRSEGFSLTPKFSTYDPAQSFPSKHEALGMIADAMSDCNSEVLIPASNHVMTCSDCKCNVNLWIMTCLIAKSMSHGMF
jgi:hypothetical protein